jgi:hypothetical protein
LQVVRSLTPAASAAFARDQPYLNIRSTNSSRPLTLKRRDEQRGGYERAA